MRAATSAAFTLIELLTVIAIIGILAAIIIPVTGRVRESAKAATCLSNLRQIGIGNAMFSADNKNMLNCEPLGASGANKWSEKVKPYIPVQAAANSFTGVFNCPSFLRTTAGSDYSISEAVGIHAVVAGVNTVTGRKISDFQLPSKKVYMVDSHRGSIVRATEFYRVPATSDTFSTTGGYLAYRHGGKCNILFIDGHVAAVGFPPLPATRDDTLAGRWLAHNTPAPDLN